MQLPVVPVHDLEDVTLNMEALQGALTSPGATLPFLQLLAAGKVAVNYGTVTFSFSASATSGSVTIPHGIGRVPRVFFQNASAVNLLASTITAVDATNVTANAFTTNNATTTANTNFYWLAIG